ncbi:MAG: Crp/Fnr family transcriptional regulator, partial [Candidatus Thiodiazotropha sp. 6PDIVS]
HLLSFESDPFKELLRGSVDTCFYLLADMSHRLRMLIREIDDLTLQSASCRVASFLWNRWSLVKAQGDSIELQAPKGVIASRLSVTPETFSRILHNFSDQGVIRVDGSRVDILDDEGLQTFAGLNKGAVQLQLPPEKE